MYYDTTIRPTKHSNIEYTFYPGYSREERLKLRLSKLIPTNICSSGDLITRRP